MTEEYLKDDKCPVCGEKTVYKITHYFPEEPITHSWYCKSCDWLVED